VPFPPHASPAATPGPGSWSGPGSGSGPGYGAGPGSGFGPGVGGVPPPWFDAQSDPPRLRPAGSRRPLGTGPPVPGLHGESPLPGAAPGRSGRVPGIAPARHQAPMRAPGRRGWIVVGLLVALTTLPTLVVILAGRAALKSPLPREPSRADGPPAVIVEPGRGHLPDPDLRVRAPEANASPAPGVPGSPESFRTGGSTSSGDRAESTPCPTAGPDAGYPPPDPGSGSGSGSGPGSGGGAPPPSGSSGSSGSPGSPGDSDGDGGWHGNGPSGHGDGSSGHGDGSSGHGDGSSGPGDGSSGHGDGDSEPPATPGPEPSGQDEPGGQEPGGHEPDGDDPDRHQPERRAPGGRFTDRILGELGI
jgi:hypothetical protein